MEPCHHGAHGLTEIQPLSEHWPSRLPPALRRLKPGFVIIGAQKAGTTSLYRYLRAHPRMRRPREKEPGYFSMRADRPLAWYARRFPRAPTDRMTCDASASYLRDPRAPARLAEILPEARLVAVLRDPVGRAYSHYQHNVRRGREPRTFRRAVDDEIALGFPRDPMEDVAAGRPVDQRLRFGYLCAGLYAQQLERWHAAVAPERLLVVDSDDLRRRTQETVDAVTDHVGLPRFRAPVLGRHNVGGYPALDDTLRDELAERFAPHDERLSALLGRPFSWMHAARTHASAE